LGAGPGPPYRPLFKSKIENRSGRSLGPAVPRKNASLKPLREGAKSHQRGPPCAKKSFFRPGGVGFLLQKPVFRGFRPFPAFLAIFGHFWPICPNFRNSGLAPQISCRATRISCRVTGILPAPSARQLRATAATCRPPRATAHDCAPQGHRAGHPTTTRTAH